MTLRYELAEEALVIEGDLTQLRQVVMNLVTNAADAIGASTGTITLRTHGVSLAREELSRFTLGELREPGRFVSIEVEDTGAGMSAETRARIFEPFFTTKFTGRGLGLSGVLGILRAHGGAIDVQSEEGVGSTFRVLLPRVADDVVVEPVAPAPKAPSQPSASRTILVVDDEIAVRRVMRRMLERNGFRIIEASDGVEALEIFGRQHGEIDVVVLDFMMPRMSGDETLQKLKKIDPDVRVVLASGYSENDATSLGLSGVAAFVMKPFTPQALLECVDTALTRR